jgi:hypothetical protein
MKQKSLDRLSILLRAKFQMGEPVVFYEDGTIGKVVRIVPERDCVPPYVPTQHPICFSKALYYVVEFCIPRGGKIEKIQYMYLETQLKSMKHEVKV